MAAVRYADASILLVPGSVFVASAVWMAVFSRPRSFDPFLGAWCGVNGICAVYVVAYRGVGDLEGLGHLMIWAIIGLPLALVALVIAVNLHQQPVATAP